MDTKHDHRSGVSSSGRGMMRLFRACRPRAIAHAEPPAQSLYHQREGTIGLERFGPRPTHGKAAMGLSEDLRALEARSQSADGSDRQYLLGTLMPRSKSVLPQRGLRFLARAGRGYGGRLVHSLQW